MRILRYLALLLIVVATAASAQQNETPAGNLQPKIEWKTPVRGPDGMFRFAPLGPPVEKARNHLVQQYGPGGNTCYFIRSYVMHREDDTDVTHLDHVTTCTPTSRFQMRKTVRVIPAIAK